MIFFGFIMFVIGAIVGRITMAIQYEVMKTAKISRPDKKKYRPSIRKPQKLEIKAEDDSYKQDFYNYISKK